MGDDQSRYNANHASDTGALADVVPYDGIGGNPGCPVWQVAYIVIARNLWKHHGRRVVPTLKKHYSGLQDLMGWFNRHAGVTDTIYLSLLVPRLLVYFLFGYVLLACRRPGRRSPRDPLLRRLDGIQPSPAESWLEPRNSPGQCYCFLSRSRDAVSHTQSQALSSALL